LLSSLRPTFGERRGSAYYVVQQVPYGIRLAAATCERRAKREPLRIVSHRNAKIGTARMIARGQTCRAQARSGRMDSERSGSPGDVESHA